MTINNIDHLDQEPKAQRTYHMGTGITYSMAQRGGSAQVGFALAATGNLTAGTGATGAAVLGQLILVEPPDNVSTKGTVRVSGVCRFMAEGTIAVGDKIVCGPTAGKVRAALTADAHRARGIVTDVSNINAIEVEL